MTQRTFRRRVVDSIWFQIPAGVVVYAALSSLAGQVWKEQQVDLPINMMFLPPLAAAVGIVIPMGFAIYCRMRIKYFIAYMLLATGMLLLVHGMFIVTSIFNPPDRTVVAHAHYLGGGSYRPMTKMSPSEEEFWEDVERGIQERKAANPPKEKVFEWAKALGLDSLSQVLSGFMKDLPKVDLPEPPPALMVFMCLFGSAVLGVVGGVILEGRSFPGEIRTFAELEARYPFFKGFEERYQKDLAPWLAEQERSRVQVLRIRHIAYLIGVPLILEGLFERDWIATVLIFMIMVPCAEWGIWSLKKDLKKKLRDALCLFLNLEYEPEPLNPGLSLFWEIGIVPYFTDSTVKDMFSGIYAGVHFRMYRARLVAVTHQYRDNGALVVFNGAIIQLTFPRLFRGCTKILKDRGLILNAMKSAFNFHQHKFDLGRKDLENVFEAYSDDDAGAKILVTSGVIENLAALSELLVGEVTIQAVFNNHTAVMAIDRVEDLFKCDMSTPLTNPARICHFAEEIATIYSMIDVILQQQRTAPEYIEG